MDDLPPPKTLIGIGETAKAYSMTNSSVVYLCKRHDYYSYSCSCPAWKMAKGKPADARSCKHLRSLLGDAHENARCDESKKTEVYTPATNPVNIKKTAREDARIAAEKAAGGSGAAKKSTKKRPTTSILDSDSVNAGASTSAPKRARQASSKSKEKESDGGEAVADVDEARPEGTGGRDLLLAHKFELDGKIDPKGWWVSEKLDGVRAYWDGQTTLWSRTGKALSAPQDFLAQLPRGRSLDGELYIGRNRFDETSGIVRSLHSPRWDELKYMVFDAPFLSNSPFEDRLACLESLFPSLSLEDVEKEQPDKKKVESCVALVEHKVCQGMEELKKQLVEVQNLGGEGLMLRQPGSLYVGKRSRTLLKVKTFYDAEAKVVGYEAGKGKYEGMTGSLVCQMQDGKTTFSVGSGLTDERRQSPPAVGSIITYRFFELTKQGIPRFPTFVGERVDAESAKDAIIRGKNLGQDEVEAGSSNANGKGKGRSNA
ncbi:uncharacterized protein JCM6883_000948 [Sporobolomyces salmoneus]|uniref:uncharacterized protein n=1 Tax=Sporobolomyces salmoneus TaxID=183962 RepID=UPI0031703C22